MDRTTHSDVRLELVKRVRQEENVYPVFLESICTDPNVLEQNIRMKLQSPDYIDVPEAEALDDFRRRIRNYEMAYETIGEVGFWISLYCSWLKHCDLYRKRNARTYRISRSSTSAKRFQSF
jgi:hypothetical protein